MATNTSRPKRSSTPASMPAASAIGTRCINRANRPEKPASMPSTAASRKAPVASESAAPPAPTTSMAAPGVDHAVTSGTR
ncbi:hypothetical protein G6F56_014537 [Rhizopus delemar]|nr:hypothetical protein G6F56_014537 [Rhizopus delemar]